MDQSQFQSYILNRIPDEEKSIYQTMRHLDHSDKQILWKLIKDSNKENVAIYKGNQSTLNGLLNKRLIDINRAYKTKGPEISLFVLNRAPYLMRVLKREYLS
ncbi:hypothetical protein E3U55_06435 [Filobacillus milosensis]|uniref:Uncharacterized protein n=1 Tax=Filobacillus milosensis TaxID=94137 RepID=A0A4Y8IS86_9BACI|nr:hypothetical protein [Filobacillus milosensis]TFB22872.1 hypothetical protein E3U55_06435 [Filobacillus milosensis]